MSSLPTPEAMRAARAQASDAAAQEIVVNKAWELLVEAIIDQNNAGCLATEASWNSLLVFIPGDFVPSELAVLDAYVRKHLPDMADDAYRYEEAAKRILNNGTNLYYHLLARVQAQPQGYLMLTKRRTKNGTISIEAAWPGA
jgi:hypothetical protein